MPYEHTEVPVAKSQEGIAKLLRAHGGIAVRTTSYISSAFLEFASKDKQGQVLSYRIKLGAYILDTTNQ